MNTASASIIDAAEKYAARGWAAFPVRGKIPTTPQGFNDAVNDPAKVEALFKKYPGNGIAIATGKISGVFVLDVDVKRHPKTGEPAGGDDTLRELEAKHGELPETISSITPSKGRHYFFKYPNGGIGSNAGVVGKGLDIRGDGGYVVAPPSAGYEWEVDHGPDIGVVDSPDWLLKINAKGGDRSKKQVVEGKIVEARNVTLTSLAGTMRRKGMSFESILVALQTENHEKCKPPLASEEVEKIAKSVSKYEPTDPEVTIIVKPLATIHIADVVEIKPTYLIQEILLESSVGIVSAQPGTCKTWLAWYLAVCIASGNKAFGKFEVKQSRVLAFNAEDDPSRITKQRIAAFAKGLGLNLRDIDFYLIAVPSLQIDQPEIQQSLCETIRDVKPALLILDPLRNVHSRNEDSASDMAPMLDFARSIQRELECSVLLICHDRKFSKENTRRESQTRGSNALEGFRDTAIYLDKIDDGIAVKIYHRGAPAPEPFMFRLSTKDANGELVEANLELVNEGEAMHKKANQGMQKVREILLNRGSAMTRKEIQTAFGPVRKSSFDMFIREMVARRELKEVPEGKSVRLWFRELDEVIKERSEREPRGN